MPLSVVAVASPIAAVERKLPPWRRLRRPLLCCCVLVSVRALANAGADCFAALRHSSIGASGGGARGGALLGGPRGGVVGPRHAADAEVVDNADGKMALAKLEAALEEQISQAKAEDNPTRLRDLARLLVLAKTAEGLAVAEATSTASGRVMKAVSESLQTFVGKEDYDFKDVTLEVKKRCASAVEKLDDIYIEDIQREMELAGQAAVSSFTGKEEYAFGDITKEVAARAKDSVSAFTGKSDYKFGDISKEALKRGGDFVKEFTGKDEYKFGDITKTAFKKIFGGGDEK